MAEYHPLLDLTYQHATVLFGKPFQFTETRARDCWSVPGKGFVALVNLKGQDLELVVPHQHLSLVFVNQLAGSMRLNGEVWCHTTDVKDAKIRLLDTMAKRLRDLIPRIERSLQSLASGGAR